MTTETVYHGARRVALRRMDGLTQTALGATLGVNQSFVSQIEHGDKPFPADLARQAATEFDVPIEFFTVTPSNIDTGIITFRKSSKAGIRYEQMVRQYFTEAARLFEAASLTSGYHPADLSAAVGEDVEETATNIRSMLGLGPTDPVPNATRALERLGVGVVHDLMSTDCDEVVDHHGLSCPGAQSSRPLVATVGAQPGAVARMTVLHELGHLLYDAGLVAPIRSRRGPEESRAFAFAGAMLIPADIVKRRITETLTLHGYLRVKADYGISVAALIKRAADLHVISAARSRSLFIQLNSQGWRRDEPVPVPAEGARLLGQAAAHGLSPDPKVVSRTVGVRLQQVVHWAGLTPSPPPPSNVIPLRR